MLGTYCQVERDAQVRKHLRAPKHQVPLEETRCLRRIV